MKFTFFLSILISLSAAASTPTPTPGNLLHDPNGFLQFEKKPGAEVETLQIIEAQDRLHEGRVSNHINLQEQIAMGQARAQQMITMLKDEELQRALKRITPQAKQLLQENPELKNPLAIVAGAFSLWAGRTIKLIKSESLKVETHLEARARSGNFALESPFLKGKVSFSGNDGLSIAVNRTISSLNSTAELSYNAKQQSFSGQISHPLSPNLDFTFGASQLQQTNQTDSNAKIEYRLSF